jgi:hypothetical protein
MNRSVVVPVGLFAALLIVGCDSLFSSSGNQKTLTGLDPDGGVCTKDEQVIKNVMLAPPTCNATNPCPCGTFCSSQTGGNCVADCYDDTWCAPGYSCSGYGQCLASGPDGGAPGGGNVDPSCPRNEALLNSITTMRRSCQFDDQCPNGSYCHPGNGWCQSDCRADSDCASMNGDGGTFVCSCMGKCEQVAGPRTPPTQVLPKLEVTPNQFAFARPNPIVAPVWGGGGTREVRVVSVAQLPNPLGTPVTGPQVKVYARPGPGLMVQCPGDAEPSSNTCTFTIAATAYAVAGAELRSNPVTLILKPSTGAPTATAWSLRVESTDAANTPKFVSLAYAPVKLDFPSPPNPVEISAPVASYRGYGQVKLTTALGATLNVPVLARAWNGKLLLFDDTRVLSPSGKIVANAAELPLFLQGGDRGIARSGGESVLSDVVKGSMLATLTPSPLFSDSSSGTLSGGFAMSIQTEGSFWGPLGQIAETATFVLQTAVSTHGYCSTASDCSNGAICDAGFCTTGGPRYETDGTYSTAVANGNYPVGNVYYPSMADWSGYSPSSAAMGWGYVGIYAPSSWVANSLSFDWTNGFSLSRRLPPVSGEPLATLYDGSGAVVVADVMPKAIPLLTQQDTGSPSKVVDLFNACMKELARVPSGPAVIGAIRSETFDFDASCINLGRVSWGLLDQNTFQRMLEGWLTVQSFVGRQGLELARLASALGGAGLSPGTNSTVATSNPTLAELVGTLEKNLSLTLGVAGSNIYGGIQVPIFENSDYRRAKFGTTCSTSFDCNVGNASGPQLHCDATVSPSVCRPPSLAEQPHHEQLLGVPNFLLQAASAYLGVLTAYVTETSTRTFGAPADSSPASARATALAHYGTGMRLILFMEQWAHGINTVAGIDTMNETCPGEPSDCQVIARRFNAATKELNILRGRLMAAAQALYDNSNPFSIPEDDVPLFFGDATGPVSRYFAASDYLLNGWALPAVNQTQAYLDSARNAWIARAQAKVQDELNKHNRQQEIDQLMSKYATPILANCGNLQVPSGTGGTRLLDSTQVIPYFADGTKTLSNEACYIDQSCGGGAVSLDSNASLRFLINSQFVNADGTLVMSGSQSAAAKFVASETCKVSYFTKYLPAEPYVSRIAATCPNGSGCTIEHSMVDGNLYFTNGTNRMPLAALLVAVARKDVGTGKFYSVATDVPGAGDNNIYGYFDLRTDTRKVTIKAATSGAPDTRECFPAIKANPAGGAASTCETTGTPGTPALTAQAAIVFSFDASEQCSGRVGFDYPPPAAKVLPANCYKGAMGVAYRQMQSDILRIQAAKQELQNGVDTLGTTKAMCEFIDKGIKNITALQTSYNGMVSAYHTAQTTAGLFSGFTNFIAGAASGNPGIAIGGWNQIINTGVEMSKQAVEEEANKLAQMQQNFGNELQARECWNSFLAQRGALATAMTNVQIAVSDLGAQQVVFTNLARQNDLSMLEGIAVLRQEEGSPVSSLSHHLWVDEKVEQFRKEFEWARRLLYLAMRAVEYEFQQSLPYRSDVVSAKTPAELQDVVIGLQAEQASRTINRRRPDEASVVLSLRDDVLAIPDNTHASSGERQWLPAERFRSRVVDTKYAYRDSKGNYLGQAVPFTLRPKGVLATRCGERLWTATATIQGDGIDARAPGASVLLLKRNTFASQYCAGQAPTISSSGAATNPQQMQVGVVHESAALFRPGASVDLSDATEFTAAMLFPWFNVRRSDFYKTSYQDGASEELAGRGLYGDYVLLFPKEIIDDGFALDRVEDVLLRLDYLSVDNLSQ